MENVIWWYGIEFSIYILEMSDVVEIIGYYIQVFLKVDIYYVLYFGRFLMVFDGLIVIRNVYCCVYYQIN